MKLYLRQIFGSLTLLLFTFNSILANPTGPENVPQSQLNDSNVALQINTNPHSSFAEQGVTIFDLQEEVLPFYLKEADNKKVKIYFVRHAEKADDGTRDPDLNAAGQARAANLAKVLKGAGIDAIYSTPYKRTQQTGQPLADQLELEIQSYNPSSATAIFDIIANHSGETILIVGHSNTTPTMINQLVKKTQLDQLSESDYGDLFKVTYKKGKGKLKRKKF
jgi:broad specificity phosphatase PhoE